MTASTKPYWHKILSHYENKGYISNGLTLPYLIGSLQIIDNDANLCSIKEMIESFDDYGCTILKCDNIGEYVIGTLDKETFDDRALYFNIGNRIIVTDDSLNHIKSVDELIIFFKDLYEYIIEDKGYSKENNNWSNFNDVETAKILEFKDKSNN